MAAMQASGQPAREESTSDAGFRTTGDLRMFLPELAVPATLAVSAIVRRAVRRDDHSRTLELFAGIVAIVARDERPTAKRAMDVLLLLLRGGQPPPGA
jgi:hypothetical protein